MGPPPGAVAPELSNAIDLVEAVYEFNKPESEWLDRLVQVGAPLFDRGLGFAIDEYQVMPWAEGAEVSIDTVRTVSLPADYEERLRAATRHLPRRVRARVFPLSHAGTWTEVYKDYPAEMTRALTDMGYPDVLRIVARDPNGMGIRITAPLSGVEQIAPRFREQWQMLGAHIAAAYRLRRALALSRASGKVAASGLPYQAEAMVDPVRLEIVDAAGAGRQESASQCLRRAAREIDRARSLERRKDTEEALRAWKALVCGRWTMVDWFDEDRRRFLLALVNRPEVRDPRGLTDQECEVVEYAVNGETNKLIAYRLGLSQARVSTVLRSAMKKLGVKNRAQLVQRLPPLPLIVDRAGRH